MIRVLPGDFMATGANSTPTPSLTKDSLFSVQLLAKSKITLCSLAILTPISRRLASTKSTFTKLMARLARSNYLPNLLIKCIGPGTLSVLQCVNEDCTHVWQSANAVPVTLTTAIQGPVTGQTDNTTDDDDDDNDNDNDDDNSHRLAVAEKDSLPKCSKCREIGRPNVSMFGDDNVSWKPERAHAQRARMFQFLRRYVDLKATSSPPDTADDEKARKRLVIIEIGCGQSIHSLRCDVELLVQQFSNVDLIRLNPDLETPRCFEKTNRADKGAGVGAGGAKVLLPVGAKDGIVGIGKLLGAVSSRPARFSHSIKRWSNLTQRERFK